MRKRYLIFGFICLLVIGNCYLSGKALASSGPFPLYPSIEPNVHFWTDIYTRYPTTKGIIHDSHDLSIVYNVIELIHPDRHGARAINRKRIKKAKQRYKIILERLAQNASAIDPEARRVADLFGLNPDPSVFRKARYRIRCQVGQKDRFRKGLVRSGAYLDEIKRIFQSHGLPEDLSYLPHVESSFNPKAYSKFGAAGIWQFTRSTGRQFMNVGYSVDERRDPIESSKAAARLLKQNYKRLQNWPMAITAYNHGLSGMLRAKRTKGGYEAVFNDYKSRIFRFASRNFYSEFLAARQAAKNHGKYFGAIDFDTPVRTRKVVLDGYVGVEDLSCYFDVSMSTIRRLNPSLRPPIFNGQKYVPKGYLLTLPADTEKLWQNLSAQLPKDLYKSAQKPSRFHRIKRGETIAKIAKMYGLKPSALILANNLNARGTIYANQTLRLPVPDATIDKKPTQETSSIITAGKRKQEEQTAMMSPRHAVFSTEPGSPGKGLEATQMIVADSLEVVRVMTEGGTPVGIIRAEIEETLGHYADWLGIPTHKIRRLNGFAYGTVLRIHQELKIPLHGISKERFEEARFEYHQKIQEDFFRAYKVDDVKTYRVKHGDSLWTLCQEVFKTPLWLVKRYNPEVDFGDLRWSQTLLVPITEGLVENNDIAL
ncbi:MAG: transglycosylase SLT domain-containing protein [Desulfatiglans sp.]|jgi:membrane-bound lytic murein transglycosylase D|nr:transglycosylase SLT domain-containing protein [Thermodesulfobacteriota bacterium]MEE4353076.1 transglycosylase SLT domain-containing protein [Desulfatiglans sp.]